jgi:predicted nucleotidyltransferase
MEVTMNDTQNTTAEEVDTTTTAASNNEPNFADDATLCINEVEENTEASALPLEDDEAKGYIDFLGEFLAKDNDLDIEHDKDNPYKIVITSKDNNSTTDIQIDHGRNLTMTAKDENNKTVVPDQKMFNAIAELAKAKDLSITFGNIKDPEYAARLYIACKNNEVPMRDIPDIDLDKLESQTKEEYEALANEKETTENQQNQTTDKATTDNQEEPHNNAAPNSAQKVDSTKDVTDKTEKSSNYTNTLTSDQTQKDITNKIQNLRANLKLPVELKNAHKSTKPRISPPLYKKGSRSY